MTVSSLSICLALKKISEITCGTRPETIHIKIIDPLGRIISVSLPSEYQSEVFSYLSQHIGIQQPVRGQPLLLTSNQASAVVALALNPLASRSAA